jgi:hypothetical protein
VRNLDSAADLPRAVSFSRLLDGAGAPELFPWPPAAPLPLARTAAALSNALLPAKLSDVERDPWTI